METKNLLKLKQYFREQGLTQEKAAARLGQTAMAVSKLLGHSNVSVTQIYAKVLDDAKRKAVGSIPDITGNKRVTRKTKKKGRK